MDFLTDQIQNSLLASFPGHWRGHCFSD